MRMQGLLTGAALVILAAVTAFAVQHAYTIYDDAYIYFRYAQNFSRGCPLAFNCADGRAEGFSSPLYLLILLLSGFLTDDLESASLIVGLLTLAAGCWLGVRVSTHQRFADALGHIQPYVAVSLTMLFVTDNFLLQNATNGMEVGLASMAVGAATLAALDGRWRALKGWIIVAILCRPECATFALALPLLREARHWRFWVPLAIAAFVMEASRLALFGDLMPLTFWAKRGGSAAHASLGLDYIVEFLTSAPATLLAPLAILAVPKGARSRAAYVVAAATLWLLSFLQTGGDHFVYSRLAAPLLPVLSAFGLTGAGAVLHRVGHASPRRDNLFGVAVLMLAGLRSTWTVQAHDLPSKHGFDNVRRWAAVGRALEAAGAHSIAATPIGAIAYATRLRVIDIVGITSPEVGRGGERCRQEEVIRERLGHERYSTQHVLDAAPDVIMTLYHQDHPITRRDPMKTIVCGEWKLVEAIASGGTPYRPATLRLADDVHWFVYVRGSAVPLPSPR